MQADFSTIIGVVGVTLTVLFFMVGYRQTIGARKERVRSTNQKLSEGLFRRLSLEEGFAPSHDEIEKMIVGCAIGARVKSAEMYSSEELESILIANTLENDHFSGDQRRALIDKIGESFKKKEEPSSVLANRIPRESAPIERSLLWLGISSVGAASVAVLLPLGLTSNLRTPLSDETAIQFIPVIAAMVTVVFALAAYTSLRERTNNYRSANTRSGLPEATELLFYQSLRRSIPDARRSFRAGVDFEYERAGKKIGIEYKRALTSQAKVRSAIAQGERAINKYGFDKIYIVYKSKDVFIEPKSDRDGISLLSESDFFKMFNKHL